MREHGYDFQVPQRVRDAFAGRTYLSTPEVARLLGMNVVTLREHADAGDIVWRQKGLGAKRPRRVFTLSDVVGFLSKMSRGRPWERGARSESSASRDHLSGGTTLSSTGVDITRQRIARRKELLKAIADGRYRDAVLAAREKQKKRERDGADPTELTVDEAFSQWWTEHGINLAEEDLGPYVSLQQIEDDPALAERPFNWLAAQVGRDKKLIHITTSDVLTVIGKRREKLAFDGHYDDGQAVYRVVSDRTVGKLLRRIMNWAAEALDADIPGPKKLKWSKVIFEEKLGLERKPLSVEEEAGGPELAAIQRFALATSLRIAEIVSLTLPQVDSENREIRLIQKGERDRTIPMTAEIEAILLPLQGQHKMDVFTFVARRTRKDRWGNKVR